MKIAGAYSFKDGLRVVEETYPQLLEEIRAAIRSVNAGVHRTKESKEKTMTGKMLYNPVSINASIKQHLFARGWSAHRVLCDYPTQYYVDGYQPPPSKKRGQTPFREMDFVKDGLGVEVQFGKYSFMVYNVCAKMTIFHNMGIIGTGVEVVPVKAFAEEMSTGVSYFEQFVWDLEQRGVSDIDIPVLIIGIDQDDANEQATPEDRRVAQLLLNVDEDQALIVEDEVDTDPSHE